MADRDVDWWTHTAKHVFMELRDSGIDRDQAVGLTEAILSEVGRDRRTEQIGEQRRGSPEQEDWRSKPVSERQREVLMKEGYTKDQLDDMTRGEASNEIDKIIDDED